MGLRLSFDVDDLGLQTKLEDENYGIIVPVDYSEAFEAFVDTFINEACDLVPVDTGFLMSTIDGDAGEDECEVYATADYAQYVEYGTYKMDAQPYFEPAVEEAYKIFMSTAQEIMEEAQEDLQNQVEAAQAEEQAEQEAARAAQEAMNPAQAGGENFLGSLIATVITMAILFPLAVIAYGIADTLSGGSSRDGGSDSFSGGADLLSMIEIDD